MKKGIMIGGMVLGLLMGCNNGGEDPQKVFLKSVVSLGNDFLNVFTSFGDIISGSLGFNTESKKSDVANYFKKVQDTVQGTKDKLNAIIENMKREGNPNASIAEGAVNKLVGEKLDKIIDGAKIASEAIGSEGGDLLGNVANQNAAGAAGNVTNLIKGIKSIIDVVLKGIGSAKAGDDKKASDGSTPRTNGNAVDGEAAKLFVTGNGAAGTGTNAKKVVTDAAKAVGAITGADILQAMVEDNGKAAKLAENNDANANVGVSPKDAVIAGGIALRAMAKGGKFANANDSDAGAIATTIKGAAISAVTKALDALTIAIRKTIDEELKKVKEAMKINPEDTPVITEAKN